MSSAPPSRPADTARPVGPPPPFDPEVAAGLPGIHQDMPPTVTADMIGMLRERGAAEAATDTELACHGAFAVERRAVRVSGPGDEGEREIGLLICRPALSGAALPGAAPTGAVPAGAIYYTHGGGMVSGDYRGADVLAGLAWAQELHLALVSVDYRLAPEHPYPAGLRDCYAGLTWTAAHAAELGIDPARIVIAGASAGGGLAAGTALLARDLGGPALAGQMLLCPMLDDRNDSASARQLAGIGLWDQASNSMGWSALLGAARDPATTSPYAAPARATDLSGLPPAFIDVGSAETFRDEAVAYASALWRAGSQAELHSWPGGCHGFDLNFPDAALSRSAIAQRVPWLRRTLGR
jgi:acetyl esterase/lipase